MRKTNSEQNLKQIIRSQLTGLINQKSQQEFQQNKEDQVKQSLLSKNNQNHILRGSNKNIRIRRSNTSQQLQKLKDQELLQQKESSLLKNIVKIQEKDEEQIEDQQQLKEKNIIQNKQNFFESFKIQQEDQEGQEIRLKNQFYLLEKNKLRRQQRKENFSLYEKLNSQITEEQSQEYIRRVDQVNSLEEQNYNEQVQKEVDNFNQFKTRKDSKQGGVSDPKVFDEKRDFIQVQDNKFYQLGDLKANGFICQEGSLFYLSLKVKGKRAPCTIKVQSFFPVKFEILFSRKIPMPNKINCEQNIASSIFTLKEQDQRQEYFDQSENFYFQFQCESAAKLKIYVFFGKSLKQCLSDTKIKVNNQYNQNEGHIQLRIRRRIKQLEANPNLFYDEQKQEDEEKKKRQVEKFNQNNNISKNQNNFNFQTQPSEQANEFNYNKSFFQKQKSFDLSDENNLNHEKLFFQESGINYINFINFNKDLAKTEQSLIYKFFQERKNQNKQKINQVQEQHKFFELCQQKCKEQKYEFKFVKKQIRAYDLKEKQNQLKKFIFNGTWITWIKLLQVGEAFYNRLQYEKLFLHHCLKNKASFKLFNNKFNIIKKKIGRNKKQRCFTQSKQILLLRESLFSEKIEDKATSLLTKFFQNNIKIHLLKESFKNYFIKSQIAKKYFIQFHKRYQQFKKLQNLLWENYFFHFIKQIISVKIPLDSQFPDRFETKVFNRYFKSDQNALLQEKYLKDRIVQFKNRFNKYNFIYTIQDTKFSEKQLVSLPQPFQEQIHSEVQHKNVPFNTIFKLYDQNQFIDHIVKIIYIVNGNEPEFWNDIKFHKPQNQIQTSNNEAENK